MEEIIIYTIETLLLLCYIYYLVWEYSAKDVPFYIKTLTYFSWLLTFSIVLILPIDITNAARITSEDVQNITYDSLLVVWRVMYWINFLLSWIILPFFQDYEDSGDFDVKERIRYSIRKNLLIYAVGMTVGILLILYLIIWKQKPVKDIEGVLAGLGNVFGLLLVVILLGYGLVAIPKRYIRESNEEAVLNQVYSDAIALYEQKTEKLYELEELSKALWILHNEYTDSEYQKYLNIIIDHIPNKYRDQFKKSNSTAADQYKPLNLKQLGILNRLVKRLMFDMMRLETKFQVLYNKSQKLEKKTNEDQQFETKTQAILYKIGLIWNLHIRKYVNKYIGYFFAFISSLILLAELCIFLNLPIKLNLLNIMLEQIKGFYWTQIFLIIPLMYMQFCTYYGLFAMKISGLISFNKNHHTDAPSLMFGSLNFGRVSFPLCFNFLQLTELKVDTSYTEIIGSMDVIPGFDKTFKTLLPLMLLVMCFFNLFNLGSKIMMAIGLSDFTASEEQSVFNSEGKKILEQWSQRETQVQEKSIELDQYRQPQQWLKTQEVYDLLKIPRIDFITELPPKPSHGQYFLIKPSKERGWKKDGYTYVPRHNGVGTREDVEKLKVNGQLALVCIYSQTKDSTLNRRIYKLLDDDQGFYLVHYLNQQQEPIQQETDLQLQFEIPQDQLLQRIQFLEQRINFLEQEKTTNCTDDYNSDKEFNIRLNDYSPEWDYEAGGAKMMLCYSPLKELKNVQIQFGDKIVDAICVQPGVLRCIVPPHSEGRLILNVLSDGQILIENNMKYFFEYTKKQKRKKKQQAKIIQNESQSTSEFKIRVIEKITSFQDFFFQHSSNHDYDCFDNLKNIDEITEEYIVTILSKILDIAKKEKINLEEFLDSQDDHGFSLIHYVTVLSYQKVLKFILENGANINKKGLDNLTSFQIAIILDKEDMVKLLIKMGAIDQSFQDQQNVDNLFNIEQIYKNKNILDLLIRGVTLSDSIHNSSSITESWNEQDDQEEAAFLILDELYQQESQQPSKQANKSQHKYLRSHALKFKGQNEKFHQAFNEERYDGYSDHVKVIQKNVRAWLLRRQYLDIKYATSVLQNCKNIQYYFFLNKNFNRHTIQNIEEEYELRMQEQNIICAQKLVEFEGLIYQLMNIQYLYVIQILQIVWWFSLTFIYEEQNAWNIRVSTYVIFLFRTLSKLLIGWNFAKSTIRIIDFIGDLGYVELIANVSDLFQYSKTSALLVLLESQKEQTWLKALYYLMRILAQYNQNYLFKIEPICIVLYFAYLLWVKDQEIKIHRSDIVIRKSALGEQFINVPQDTLLPKYFENIINIFPHGIIIINSDKQVEYINGRCEKLLEIKNRNEIIKFIRSAYIRSQQGQNYEDDQEDFLDKFLVKNCMQNSGHSSDIPMNSYTNNQKYRFFHEFRSRTNNKDVMLKIQIITTQVKSTLAEPSPNDTDNEQVIFIIVKNVTSKKKMKKLKYELHFQSSLLKSFSHELRTPLNCSIQMLHLAKETSQQSEQTLEYLDTALTQNLMLTFQINDILDFAAFQCNSFQYMWRYFVLSEIFEELAYIYNYQCKSKNIKFITQIDSNLGSLQIGSDKQRIMQVLVNLINNSLKFTKPGGYIIVKFERETSNIYRLTVVDNGIGIRQDKLERISQQSIRMNESFGLGINISSRIVWGLQQNKLEIYSNPGIGTRIQFKIKNREIRSDETHSGSQSKTLRYAGSELPLIYRQLQEIDGEFLSIHSVPSQSFEISEQEGKIMEAPKVFNQSIYQQCECNEVLVVDDVPSNQIAIKSIFNYYQIRVDQAYDGIEAIDAVNRKLETHCKYYKLIIMDIEMPNMDGFEATKEILDIYQTNIVMCSAYDNKFSLDQAQKAGISDVLSKPLQKKEVFKIINKYLI